MTRHFVINDPRIVAGVLTIRDRNGWPLFQIVNAYYLPETPPA